MLRAVACISVHRTISLHRDRCVTSGREGPAAVGPVARVVQPIPTRTVDNASMLGNSFAALLVAAQAGDESAFGTLWRDVNPTLVNYLRTQVGQGAEDVASETWADVVRGLHKFSGDATAWRSWLFTIARRRAVDELRRRARRPATPTAPQTLIEISPPAVEDTATAAFIALDTKRVLALLAELPQAQAEIVLLRVLVGLPTAQVAHILGRKEGTVRVALHRALTTLAGRIATEDVTQSRPDSIRT